MDKDAKIFVAGHRGLFGSALVRALKREGYTNLVTRSHVELDLTEQVAVRDFFEAERPQYVFMAAAKVGGILANRTDPLGFGRDNLMIQDNVFDAAHRAGCERLLFLGSSCIYPRECAQPMKEEYLLTGPLEPTNRSYAVAKIAGLELCRGHNENLKATGKGMECRAVMPPNLYGEGDHFDERGHALSGIMNRMHHAKLRGDKECTIWGTGNALREWMHVDDAASAAMFVMAMPEYEGLFYNIGTAEELSVRELAEEIKQAVGFEGELVFDSSKPDGMMRKVMDSSRLLEKGWKPEVSFAEGLARTYAYYLTLPEAKAA
ncbi:MAG: NAD-dependent epimerase/dehydratase family protein [Proteobacteria bacterium]|nr:NAD-dependent epimerase/dehydratase family protein [Pseudomonadota bacterium]